MRSGDGAQREGREAEAQLHLRSGGDALRNVAKEQRTDQAAEHCTGQKNAEIMRKGKAADFSVRCAELPHPAHIRPKLDREEEEIERGQHKPQRKTGAQNDDADLIISRQTAHDLRIALVEAGKEPFQPGVCGKLLKLIDCAVSRMTEVKMPPQMVSPPEKVVEGTKTVFGVKP